MENAQKTEKQLQELVDVIIINDLAQFEAFVESRDVVLPDFSMRGQDLSLVDLCALYGRVEFLKYLRSRGVDL